MIKKNFWKNKKVLLTGHNGFKGSWMTMILKILGAKVYGYSLKNKMNLKNEKIFELRSQLSGFIYGNIKDEKKLHKYIKAVSPEIIIHMAAQSLVIDSYKKPKFNFETNINGVLNLLLLQKKLKKKFIILVVTSDKCYLNDGNNDLKENSPLGGEDPYSASKACAEILSNSFRKSFNLPIITARAGNVVGGGDWNTNRLMPDLMRAVFEKKMFLFRNPNQSRPWQHVIDLNINYLKLIYATYLKHIPYDSWNLGPNKSYKNSFVVDFVKKRNFLEIKKIHKNLFNEKKRINLNVAKAKKIKIINNLSITKTLISTIEWYDNFYSKKISNKKFSHLQIKKYL
jgi:CDP-glucose 4,6-dehydratase